jgi:hypothetical protein
MRVAGGIIVLIFGIIGFITNFFFTALGAAGAASVDVAEAQGRDVESVDGVYEAMAGMSAIGLLLAVVLAVLGIIILVSKKRWPGVTAGAAALVYTLLTVSFLTGIPVVIGSILAIAGSGKMSVPPSPE